MASLSLADDPPAEPSADLPVRESGIAPAIPRPERTTASVAEERLEYALAETTRSEANLKLLLRGLTRLAAGASAALESNIALGKELEALQDMVACSHAEELTLRHRVRLLEQSLEISRREAARERATFIEQEDLFLAELLADHEREVVDLRQRMGPQKETPVPADAAPTLPPPPPEGTPTPRPTPNPSPIGSMRLRTVRLPLPVPEPLPMLEKESFEPVTEPPTTLVPPRRDSRPMLKQKPDPTTRPLGGYSLRGADVPENASPSTAPPPRSDKEG